MKKIIVIGAGGFAREVKFLIHDINRKEKEYEFLGYLVSDLSQLSELDSKDEVLGDFSWFDEHNEIINVAIGIGNPKTRINIGDELSGRYSNLIFPPLIHPNVIYDKSSCLIEKGVIICSSTVMTINIHIQEFSMLNLCCTVGHEAIIGKGSVLNPTVNISGGVNLGSGVLVGTGVQILQYVTIGDNAVIGAGACLTKSIPDNVVAVGIPVKVIKKVNE